MSKRRTRKDKLEAKHEYKLPAYIMPEVLAYKTNDSPTAPQSASLSNTQTAVIKRDIGKSVIISLLILGIEFGIYKYWFR